MKVHLPATVATKPDSGDICFSGQCPGTAGGCLRGVIYEGGDVRREKDDVGIKNLNRGEGAVLVKSPYEGEYLITVPYLFFDTSEIGHEEVREVSRVAIDVCPPEGVFLRDDSTRCVDGLSDQGHSHEEQGQDAESAHE